VGRKILFITTDQQRYDSLGATGNSVVRTPSIDQLAADGVLYTRAHNQNTVCMPARSTMITGQYVRTHGVVANGIPLPVDAPSIAGHLHEHAGYRTALIGKAHFQPGFDRDRKWEENQLARLGSTGPYRGFEHLELAMHGYLRQWHYDRWLERNGPEWTSAYYPLLSMIDMGLNDEGGGDTDAPEVKHNPIPTELYHTDWVAERTIAWLASLDASEDWFCWMSFPDPHHPWDPPLSEVRKRINWRDLDLPPGHPVSTDKAVEILAQKPHHWLDWYEGRFQNLEGGPMRFVPSAMTHDQVREITALVHVENELIDVAVGRVLTEIDRRGWGNDTDVVFTSDHGELQGDFGLLFKGPYHVDALMRVPLIWRPAPNAGLGPATVAEPVGHVDLAPTFCAIAGTTTPPWCQGEALPLGPGSGRERVITEWDSQFPHIGMKLRSIYRDGWVCTAYEPGPLYNGDEGELYDLSADPLQWRNLWDEPGHRARRDELVIDLYDHLPPARQPALAVEAPV
jgi:arylsulfatase A-like enzyme